MIQLVDIFIGNVPRTQGFGDNPAFYRQYNLAGHEGVDFGTGEGKVILSATNGKVIRAGFNLKGWEAYGGMVEVWDDVQSCACLYGHLGQVAVQEGQRVNARQRIGLSDHTGNVRPPGIAGAHLHFGVCLTDANGNRLNRNNGFGGWVNSLDTRTFKWGPFTNSEWTPPPPMPSVPLPDYKSLYEATTKQLADFKGTFAAWIAQAPK